MKLARRGFLVVACACAVASATGRASTAAGQEDQSKPKAQMFSGTVTAVDSSSLTAMRAGDGKVPATHTFVITPETTFEGGKPRVNSRVTVRYVAGDEGDRAVHVIVRASARK